MLTAILEDVFRKTLTGFGDRLAAFMPSLLAMLIILIVGIVAAILVRLGIKLLLPTVGFDAFAARMGFSVVLRQGGITALPSAVVSVVLAWTVLAVFVLLAIGALNLQFAMDLLSRAFLYLPQLLIALALVVLGSLIAGFVRRSVLIAAVNAELPSARLLASGAQSAVLIFVLAMALEHLGVGRQIILVSFAILFGGLVLALALAFGFAGRDLAREALERLVHRPHEGEVGEDTFKHL